ncbi:MAG: stage III sporulation protein AB, partial [Butyricicoccus pullicaecorum]|nr:stage III sporulation protein AB [Butyricicoccus pullicaecorum]
AANCGVTVLATIHAAGVSELRRKPFFRALCESGAFAKVVTLTAGQEGRSCRITALEGGKEPC